MLTSHIFVWFAWLSFSLWKLEAVVTESSSIIFYSENYISREEIKILGKSFKYQFLNEDDSSHSGLSPSSPI